MKLIFIDDDSMVNAFHTIFLTELEVDAHQYKIYDSPTEAVKDLINLKETAQTIPYQILFLDINMPKMTGWDVLDELSILKIKIPQIYILSTSSNSKDIQRAKAHPLVAGFISKPIELEALEAYIAPVLS